MVEESQGKSPCHLQPKKLKFREPSEASKGKETLAPASPDQMAWSCQLLGLPGNVKRHGCWPPRGLCSPCPYLLGSLAPHHTSDLKSSKCFPGRTSPLTMCCLIGTMCQGGKTQTKPPQGLLEVLSELKCHFLLL